MPLENEEGGLDEGAVEYGTHAVGLDEIEQANTRPTRVDYSKIAVEGDEIPEPYRGKTVADLVEQAERNRKALEISENARLALQNSQQALETASRQPVPIAPAAPAPEPEPSEEELREMYEKDPFSYQQFMNQRLEKRLATQFEHRLAPVMGSNVELALQNARSRYPDEFAALGTEIDQFVKTLPDKTPLANASAVDDLVAFVRGKYFTKFMTHLNSKQGGDLDTARRRTADETPVEFNNTPRIPRQSRGAQQLDDTQKAVAEALGVSYEDYAANLPRSRGRNG